MTRYAKFLILFFIYSCTYAVFSPDSNSPIDEWQTLPGYNDRHKYDAVIKKNIELFEGLLKFDVDIRWDDPNLNAYSKLKDNGDWTLVILGGLANHSLMTVDGMATVLCHELGHLLGDANRIANQGQANYYASHVCLKKMFAGETAENDAAAWQVASYPKNLCDTVFSSDEDRKVCYRSMIATKVSVDIAAAKVDRNPNAKVNYDTPDPKVVNRTDINGGGAQCYLDTYMAGALCPVLGDDIVTSDEDSQDLLIKSKDALARACSEGLGARPRCWFNQYRLHKFHRL